MLDERLCDMNDIEISTLQLDILLIGAFRSGLTDLPNDRDNLNGQSWLQISCRCSQLLLMHNHLLRQRAVSRFVPLDEWILR